jgi:hypothetical protein
MSSFDPYDPTANDPKQTTGLGIATNVVLTGLGVLPIVPFVPGTRGVSQFKVSVPIGGFVQVTALPVDDSGAPVSLYPPGTGGGIVLTPQATHLGTAANFAILAHSSIVGSAGAGSVITGGDVGLYPGTAISSFPPDYVVPPNVQHITDAAALQAQTDLTAAIAYYSGLSFTALGSDNMSVNGNLTANTYKAGNYSGGALDIPTTIYLDAQGNPQAVFVFKASSTLTLESGAQVVLLNGAQAGNVYWVVGSSATTVWNGIQSNMVGTIMATASVTLGGGNLQGRALASTATVTLSTTELITSPILALVPSGVPYGVSPYGCNAIVKAAAPLGTSQGYGYELLPSWYRPNPFGGANVLGAKAYAGFALDMASATVDDDDANPWTVRGRFPGQVIIDFQIPTFGNNEGQSLVDVNTVMDETYIDTIDAQLIVTVTGGTS